MAAAFSVFMVGRENRKSFSGFFSLQGVQLREAICKSEKRIGSSLVGKTQKRGDWFGNDSQEQAETEDAGDVGGILYFAGSGAYGRGSI